MWSNHHWLRSAGGRANFQRSSPERTMPTPPKITGTMPTRSHAGLGLSTPRTASVALAAKVTIAAVQSRSEEHTSELQSRLHLVCRLLLEKKKKTYKLSD